MPFFTGFQFDTFFGLEIRTETVDVQAAKPPQRQLLPRLLRHLQLPLLPGLVYAALQASQPRIEDDASSRWTRRPTRTVDSAGAKRPKCQCELGFKGQVPKQSSRNLRRIGTDIRRALCVGLLCPVCFSRRHCAAATMGCAASAAVASQRDMQVTLPPMMVLVEVVVFRMHRCISDWECSGRVSPAIGPKSRPKKQQKRRRVSRIPPPVVPRHSQHAGAPAVLLFGHETRHKAPR